MASSNQFDLLGDVENDDPAHLLAAAEKKAAAVPKPAPAPAKLPTKPPPPAQPVREERNYGAPPRDGPGRGRGGRGGRTGPRRDFGDADAHGFEGGYGGGGGGFGDGGVARGENGEGRQAERGRGPRQPYRGGGRRGGYSDGQAGNEFGRPRRAYERHSGTGRGYGMKREGAGRGNWGTATDEGLEQDTVDAVNPEETTAVVEDEKKPEDAPQSEVEKDKEGAENEEEKEPEDKEMTLEEYEKVLEEKRKALLSLKAEERKVEIDKELQAMQQLSVKKDGDEVFIKLGSDKDLKKKESAEREERGKKSLSINEFLKPAEGERYYNPSGRGRGRGRGGFRGGYNGGYRGPAAAPAIEDQAQFPALA
uniref:Plasminogen activator inhibitor 1 RNA-binding protein n=1 Tax=Zea mays TaxID=4577 RepID=B6T4Q3_MAIZE|nr:plasminogen activator inhibitor 1 RNA-binding protein [Zea mays]|eukprot:NP_001148572.1 plasminogen activator inhibitor 1 RNA-binding protein [Zea mays]